MPASRAAGTAGATSPAPPGRRRYWRVAVAALLVVGVALSIVAGALWRSTVAHSERQTFDTAATNVAETAEMLVKQDFEFVTSLRTGLTQNPAVGDGEFDRWFGELEGPRHQIGSLGTVVVRSVPASQLASFLRARAASPAFRRLMGGRVLPVRATGRARYCLLAAGSSGTTAPYSRALATVLQGDWCDRRSAIGAYATGGSYQARHMTQLADAGSFLVYPVTAEGLSTIFIGTAFYRAGAPLRTVAERRAALLGWVMSSFSTHALARSALEGQRGLSLSLYHSDPGGALEHVAGARTAHPRARFALSSSFQVVGTWVVDVAGAEPEPAISANAQGLLTLLGGLLTTGLLAGLVSTLGRSRERALGLVAERTGELRHQAVHDALTGLPNRVLALDRAGHMLARARRERTPVAALYVDIDGFKQVNDTFGHAAGDELLRIVAQRLQSVVREGDTAARLGGDEFVVLVEGATAAAGPELVAERLLEVLRQPYDLSGCGGRELSLTASIGVASGVRESADVLLRDADLALYQAKAAGRNRYVAFESAMHTAARERAELELDLAGALDRGELLVLYQPTIDLQTERVIGLEALLRWQHPQRGLLAPDRFIALAEESGLIVPIGAWVLREACDHTAAWHAHGHPIRIAVNVSVRQLESNGLLGDVDAALDCSGLEPDWLTLEITETALMRDPDATAARLSALKTLGVRIAIDDFGTGYSSLAYLRQFPVDALKIDRSFISGIADSKQSTAIIHTLVQLGKTLHIETLAEGIENLQQLHTLQHEHCDQGQGYLFSRPVAAEAIEALLSSLPGAQPAATQVS